MQGQDFPREGLPKWGPQKVAPRLASPTTTVGPNIWSIARGVWGGGAGVQEIIAQFWPGKAQFYARSSSTTGCMVWEPTGATSYSL